MSKNPDLIKCPFTGKMIPRPERRSRVDLVDPKVLPNKQSYHKGNSAVLPSEAGANEVTTNEYNACLAELKELRTHFAALQPGQRAGAKGDKIMRQYRHESLKLLHLSGEKAPPIYGYM